VGKKLTIDFIREQFEKEGYILLTKEYKNAHQKLEYICSVGHKNNMTWAQRKQGARCPICSSNNRRTVMIESIRKLFEKEKYILLTKKYTGYGGDLEYICPKGHRDKISWGSWKYGHRCNTCSGKKRHTIRLIRERFEREGYILLSKKYKNAFGKLKYVCPKGHIGEVCWHSWDNGGRCKVCWYNKNKGESHYNWNKNLTKEDRQNRRFILGYRDWAYKIKERDNFTCQVCGQVGGNLVSHHLESYNNNPGLRIEASNGVCLCKKCHEKFHFKYGNGNNTRDQFGDFLRRENKCQKIKHLHNV
jgi:5-methylcytosine-specific restriction endonuclease McrA/DNA-directed RNA polymerase subunit RPC12/RpoP